MEKQVIGRVKAAVFDPEATFGCGQCFRWERRGGAWHGIACGRALTVRRQGGDILFESAAGKPDDFAALWADYFDLGRDYGSILAELSGDGALRDAIAYAPGLRILRQEPWEALCSFLFSQNNNIPRIRGIVARLCEAFGDPLPGSGTAGGSGFAFPAPERLAALGEGDLAPLRCGYRGSYVLDAARRVAGGALDLAALRTLPIAEAREQLLQIRGVGPKVAECTLLFGCGRLDAFPVDVWVKRVLARWYPAGFPAALRPLGGIAQQFLFHYARCGGGLEAGREPTASQGLASGGGDGAEQGSRERSA